MRLVYVLRAGKVQNASTVPGKSSECNGACAQKIYTTRAMTYLTDRFNVFAREISQIIQLYALASFSELIHS